LLLQIQGAIAGGVDVVQIRESDLDARSCADLVREVLALTHLGSCRVLVNDRLDVALATGAHGVHLRETSIPLSRARALAAPTGGHFIIGRAVHDSTTAFAARSADYMIAGSVFDTASKPGQAASLGLDGLRAVVEAAGDAPVWAVGGMSAERVGVVADSGARGIAVIGALLPAPGATEIARDVQQSAEALRFSLDRYGRGS
jgi:thiamine-phosphate pyrophosphorylase